MVGAGPLTGFVVEILQTDPVFVARDKRVLARFVDPEAVRQVTGGQYGYRAVLVPTVMLGGI